MSARRLCSALLAFGCSLASLSGVAGADMPEDVYRGIAPAYAEVATGEACVGGCVGLEYQGDAGTGVGRLRVAEDFDDPRCCGNFNVVFAHFVQTHEVPSASRIDYRVIVKINAADTDPAGLFPLRPTGGFVTLTIRLSHFCGCIQDTVERIQLVGPGQTVRNTELEFRASLLGPSDSLIGAPGPVPAGRVFVGVLFEAEAYYNGVNDPTVAEIDFVAKKVGYRLF